MHFNNSLILLSILSEVTIFSNISFFYKYNYSININLVHILLINQYRDWLIIEYKLINLSLIIIVYNWIMKINKNQPKNKGRARHAKKQKFKSSFAAKRTGVKITKKQMKHEKR